MEISYGLSFWFMPVIFGNVFGNIVPTHVTDNSIKKYFE